MALGTVSSVSQLLLDVGSHSSQLSDGAIGTSLTLTLVQCKARDRQEEREKLHTELHAAFDLHQSDRVLIANQAVVTARIEMTDSLTNVELSAVMYPSSQFIVHVAAWRKAQAAELKVCFR